MVINSKNTPRGFTLVELMIVIIVIGILAAISIVSYRGISDRAMDTRIKTIVADVGKALTISDGLDGVRPSAQGYFDNPNGVRDTLVPGYMSQNYRTGITSKNAPASENTVFRYYICGSGRFVIYASLNSPTAADISNLQSVKSTCGHSNTHAPETATGNNPRYNFAQIY